MKAKSPDGGTNRMLLNEFSVEQLVLDLSLVERFLFDILVVPSTRIADSIQSVVREEVQERRSETVELRRITVAPNRDPVAPASVEQMIDGVLLPLLARDSVRAHQFKITWVDASDARVIDHSSWAEMFARLNERRNAAISAQVGPLVLVVTPSLERIFAHSAPDFWSIRSASYRVELSDFETHILAVDHERHPPVLGGPSSKRAPGLLTVSMALQTHESVKFDDTKRSWVFSESAVQLLQRGALDEAEAAARRSIESARSALEAAPESRAAVASLERALGNAVLVAETLGDIPWWLAIADERVVLVERLMTGSPLSPEILVRRVEALRGAGLVARDGGLSMAELAVADARKLVLLSDVRAHWELLAACLSALAERLLTEQRPSEARMALTEAIEILARFDEGRRMSSAISSTQVVVYSLRARALSVTGDHHAALEDAHESVRLAKRFRAQLADAPESFRLTIVAHHQLAEVYRALGDFKRADYSLRSALAATREMMQRWPQSRMAASWRGIVLLEAARIGAEDRRGADAMHAVDEAVTIARALCEGDAEGDGAALLERAERLRDELARG